MNLEGNVEERASDIERGNPEGKREEDWQREGRGEQTYEGADRKERGTADDSRSEYLNFTIVVVTKNSFVKGFLTDGDCRRAIKSIKKDDKIEKFMTLKPLFVSENTTASKALAIMNERKITSLLVKADKLEKNKSKIKLKGIIHIHSLLKHGLR